MWWVLGVCGMRNNSVHLGIIQSGPRMYTWYIHHTTYYVWKLESTNHDYSPPNISYIHQHFVCVVWVGCTNESTSTIIYIYILTKDHIKCKTCTVCTITMRMTGKYWKPYWINMVMKMQRKSEIGWQKVKYFDRMREKGKKGNALTHKEHE